MFDLATPRLVRALENRRTLAEAACDYLQRAPAKRALLVRRLLAHKIAQA